MVLIFLENFNKWQRLIPFQKLEAFGKVLIVAICYVI